MRLNHINLTVTSVPDARDFLAKYFELRSISGAKGNNGFDVLMDDGGLVLTLMKASREGIHCPATFHIGFGQESDERVNEIYRHLKSDGFDVQPPERRHAWTFYVQAPGGFTVEVMS